MELLPVKELRGEEILLRLEKTCEARPEKQWVPAYYFSIFLPDGTKIGHCDLRVGHNDRLYIGGNIGYGIDEAYRGHHYASEACKLLLDLARKHHMGYVIITCDPDNMASRRTCELAGGKYMETAAVPEWHNMYEEGMRRVRVYRFELEDGQEGKAGVSDSETVRQQYGTASRLNTRISIHSKYSTNKQGFGNWIVSHYRLREGMSVLELGCGTGEMWLGKGRIISGCSRFVLPDFSEGMLDKAKETLRGQKGIEYRIIDIQDIPFADREFDAVIANMMLYHVPDLNKGLREVRRVMKEDGTFYCATYGENGMMKYICGLFEDRNIREPANDAFTLQTGESKLKTVFSDAERFLYEDSLEITDVGDMVEYIYSLNGMTELRQLPESEIRGVLQKNMRGGVLRVPKEYGMFIAGGFTGTGPL